MDEQKQPTDSEEVRRLRLDALFADEPFLSPTMKARRLHQKLQEYATPEAATYQPASHRDIEIVPETLKKSRPSAEEGRYPLIPPSKTAHLPGSSDAINFAEACACLRGERSLTQGGRAQEERLRRFRDEVLPKWLEGVPKQERGS